MNIFVRLSTLAIALACLLSGCGGNGSTIGGLNEPARDVNGLITKPTAYPATLTSPGGSKSLFLVVFPGAQPTAVLQASIAGTTNGSAIPRFSGILTADGGGFVDYVAPTTPGAYQLTITCSSPNGGTLTIPLTVTAALQLVPTSHPLSSPDGPSAFSATNFNDNNVIVGWSSPSQDYITAPWHAVIWPDYNSPCQPLNLAGSGFSNSEASAINTGGDVAGQGLGADGHYQAYILSHNGALTLIPRITGMADAYAIAVNDSGQVVGIAVNSLPTDLTDPRHPFLKYETIQIASPPRPHAFLFADGVVTDLGLGIPLGINNQGTVLMAHNQQSSLISSGSVTSLGTFSAASLNNKGQVVGRYIFGSSVASLHVPAAAAMWQNGTFSYLGQDDATLVNDNDWTVWSTLVFQNGGWFDLQSYNIEYYRINNQNAMLSAFPRQAIITFATS